jgi:hypothetical protein
MSDQEQANSPMMQALAAPPITSISAEDFVNAAGAMSAAQAEPRVRGLIDEILKLDPSKVSKIAAILFQAAMAAFAGGNYITIVLNALQALLAATKDS